MLKQFMIHEISQLDEGRVAAVINKHLCMVVGDCTNRPGVDDARKVTITVEVRPVVNEDGICEDADIEIVTSASVPKSRSKPMNMGIRANGRLIFNDASLDSHRQGTLDQSSEGIVDPELDGDS